MIPDNAIPQTPKLAGKVAIVTGAGSSGPGFGIGKAISVLFAREGATVVLVDQFEDRARETLDIIDDAGGSGVVVTADLADVSACQRVVEEAIAQCGGVDILVNNAAVPINADVVETTVEQYNKTIAVNLTAPFMLMKAAIPSMIERGGGAILNITSIVAMRGTGARQAAYAASKGGLVGLMTDAADSFGRQGIRVNCIAPGIIKTPMRDAVMAERGNQGADLSDRTALGVEGDPWDIARAALFLCGPDGRYVTGLLVPVDGGTTARTR